MATTWNASDKAAAIALSNGNLTATGSGGAFASVRATNSNSSGKWYFECKPTAIGPQSDVIGLITSGASLTTYPGNSATGMGIGTGGSTFVNGVTNVNAAGVTWSTSDTVCIAVDFGAGKAWVGKNGTWCASGNPASGTNPWCTFTASTALFPATGLFDNSSTVIAAFATANIAYAIPSGFSIWSATASTVSATAGSYALSGKAVQLGRLFNIAVAAGSYALSGAAVTAKKAMRIAAAAGSYALTGAAAKVAKHVSMAATAGAYALVGMAVSFPFIRTTIRKVRFVLQKLRTNGPSLSE